MINDIKDIILYNIKGINIIYKYNIYNLWL